MHAIRGRSFSVACYFIEANCDSSNQPMLPCGLQQRMDVGGGDAMGWLQYFACTLEYTRVPNTGSVDVHEHCMRTDTTCSLSNTE